MKLKRSERMVVISNYLINNPYQLKVAIKVFFLEFCYYGIFGQYSPYR